MASSIGEPVECATIAKTDKDSRPISSASVKSDTSAGAPEKKSASSVDEKVEGVRRESTVSVKGDGQPAERESIAPIQRQYIDLTKAEPAKTSDSKTSTPESALSHRSDESVRGGSSVSDEIREIDNLIDAPRNTESRPQSQQSNVSQKSLGDGKTTVPLVQTIDSAVTSSQKSPLPVNDIVTKSPVASEAETQSQSPSVDLKADEKTSPTPSIPKESSEKGEIFFYQRSSKFAFNKLIICRCSFKTGVNEIQSNSI